MRFLSEALALADEQPLIALEPRGKRPLAGLGLRHATQDPHTIARWWCDRPDANIGLRCDGLVVIDIDGPPGEASLDRLEDRFGTLPASRGVSTGKGRHLYFRCPTLVGNSTAPFGKPQGIDLRSGTRGYVAAPPSIHPSGRRYEWANVFPVAELPDEWRAALTTIAYVPSPASFSATDTAYGLRALESELERLLGSQPGQRNEDLNRSVFRLAQLVGGGELTRSRVEQDAIRFAVALLGLDLGESRQTVRSALAGGVRFPRSPRARARARE